MIYVPTFNDYLANNAANCVGFVERLASGF